MNMYLTKDAHSTIITHEEAEAVRNIMEYRSRTLNMGGERCQSRYIFSSHMKAIREDVLQQVFIDMWNKLYTNQGTVLEPLLKALTELAARAGTG